MIEILLHAYVLPVTDTRTQLFAWIFIPSWHPRQELLVFRSTRLADLRVRSVNFAFGTKTPLQNFTGSSQ